MKDARVEHAAKILVDYSTKIKKGDYVQINTAVEAQPLAIECYKLAIQRGAYPRVFTALPGTTRAYYQYASDDQLKKFPSVAMHEMEKTDAIISIGGSRNTRELTTIDPARIALRQKTTKQLSEEALKKRWVIFEYPTNAYAQEADMSLEEFEDFVFNATNVDWEKESKKQDKLKRILDNAHKIRILGEDTDLRFSVRQRTAIKCDGTHNMPDGEVFVAPVEKSVNGKIAYTYPGIRGGREVDGIKLEFKNGRVVKYSADKNESFLKAMINTDKGAKYLGEFGIGVNYGIKKFIKSILFDEKIGGTVHLALGMAYKEGGGRNESAIHWDMIKDLRHNGEIIVDDTTIQKNGKFTFKL
jgi:aminopeptidase